MSGPTVRHVGRGRIDVLLFTLGLFPWVELLVPAWVLVFSLHIVFVSFRTPTPANMDT